MNSSSKSVKAVEESKAGVISDRNPLELIKERQSKEMILGFSGAIGCGIGTVIDLAKEILSAHAYHCEHVKISEYINTVSLDGVPQFSDQESEDKRFCRYRRLQQTGNVLRERHGDYILAEYAISKIASARANRNDRKSDGGSIGGPERVAITSRTVYLVDQLKHPDEVELLRTVYGNAFYMIGVVSSEQRRSARLRSEEGVKATNISTLIEVDRKESNDHGQQLEKTLHRSDFFVSTDSPQREAIKIQLDRFFKLVHGDSSITPTRDEFGMYTAYSSGLRSACLSRQVGAALLDNQGNVLATGRNDVPAPGGGLYTPEHKAADARCTNWGTGSCRNQDEKEKIKKEFERIASEVLSEKIKMIKTCNVAVEDLSFIAKDLAGSMYKNTRVRDLIEFSRSIHAEMDVITSIARKGSASSVGGSLYSTTFPCHNCARHIVAAGIKKVVYIEPYEKSLALALHDDAITLDVGQFNEESNVEKVLFVHFEGVSPRLYRELFEAISDRKDRDGRPIRLKIAIAGQKIPAYLDPYTDFESKVADHWANQAKKI